MKVLYDKKGTVHLVFPKDDQESAIEVLLYLHDTGRLTLRSVQELIHVVKYGSVIPPNVVPFPNPRDLH